jgi:putative hydrolase of the HAD superfamily
VTIWLYTDADNTLWDTDGVYADAQLSLLSAAELIAEHVGPTTGRLEFVRQYDQAIAARHHARLRYPPALLLRAIVDGLKGLPSEEAASLVVRHGHAPTESEAAALQTFNEVLSELPSLLPSVVEGLELAKRSGCPVYVVTEGPGELLQGRLRLHNIDGLVAGTVAASKTTELYERLIKRAAPRTAVMIGDQPDRDVRLAKQAGMKAVLIPSRFRPAWSSTADAAMADIVVETFLQAIEWVIASGFRS